MPRYGEQGYAFSFEEFAARRRLRAVGSGDGQRNIGEAVTHLNGHV
jgi:hypothetical protein